MAGKELGVVFLLFFFREWLVSDCGDWLFLTVCRSVCQKSITCAMSNGVWGSDAKQVTEEHVWYKALEKNTFQPNFYVPWPRNRKTTRRISGQISMIRFPWFPCRSAILWRGDCKVLDFFDVRALAILDQKQAFLVTWFGELRHSSTSPVFSCFLMQSLIWLIPWPPWPEPRLLPSSPRVTYYYS